MKIMKPKECIHNSCKNVFFVPYYLLHMLIMCEECKIKKQKNELLSNKK
jgi:hypothetical protein